MNGFHGSVLIRIKPLKVFGVVTAVQSRAACNKVAFFLIQVVTLPPVSG